MQNKKEIQANNQKTDQESGQRNEETKKMTKQEYNRRYYEQNKHRWNGKKADSIVGNVFDLFGKSIRPSTPNLSSTSHWLPIFKKLEILILACFVVIATLFLIREAAGFYIDEQEGHFSAYLKATMIEGFAILFSISKSKSTVLTWTRKFVVILLSSFTLWVMSGKLMKTASSDTYRVQALRQTLEHLESELSQKEQLRQALLSRSLLTTARRYEKGIDQIRAKRDRVQNEVAAERSPQVIATNLSILIVFRLLLVLGNLVSIHTILEYFKCDSPLPEAKKPSRTVEFS